MNYLQRLDKFVLMPFQYIVDLIFTRFGKSHFWVATQSIHIYMVSSIIFYGRVLLDTNSTAQEFAYSGLVLCLLLFSGQTLAKTMQNKDKAWRNGRTTTNFEFDDDFEYTLLLFRLALAFISFVVFPLFFVIWQGIQFDDLMLVVTVIMTTCVFYFLKCKPPSIQKHFGVAKQQI